MTASWFVERQTEIDGDLDLEQKCGKAEWRRRRACLQRETASMMEELLDLGNDGGAMEETILLQWRETEMEMRGGSAFFVHGGGAEDGGNGNRGFAKLLAQAEEERRRRMLAGEDDRRLEVFIPVSNRYV